ncbi:site-specific DNA-methyltransferase [Streptomyces sp. SID161]|uniref:DNA-methyltransferase n=1 Tax=Streptomyces sp. SID161 TaxID=2690251 RepID=UPI0013716F3C|nr:site-specific DNA-methyltransferase [Streptomyces sp. SID161]MYW46351.1 site-specific DNA-methyltransferase [Streptomyces sp. SID161]
MSQHVVADARHLPLSDATVDLVVTSPPYWRKRDYGVDGQLGQETTPAGFVAAIVDCLTEWRRVLTPTGSVFLNVGDGYHRRALAGIPGRIEAAAADTGWLLRNRIIWTKTRGNPDPAKDRLTPRHEYVLHLTPARYHYDLTGYAEQYGRGANPGDVWEIAPERSLSPHLAPFPVELARRAIILGCPRTVCTECGHVAQRITEPSGELDPSRPQARRAMQLAAEAGLTEAHLAAIRATGISDAGKALRTQTGTGRNSAEVQRLAAEAKAALGGYFREFTFGPKRTVGWTDCGHNALRAGRVLDPFSGTGTTGIAATELGRDYVGVDLDPRCHAIASTRSKQPALAA